MNDKQPPRRETIALNTKLEEDFVAPLTAMRGALEILRDYPELAEEERVRFAEKALRGCARLEASVRHLGDVLYADKDAATRAKPTPSEHAKRVKLNYDDRLIDLDLSGIQFSSPEMVNEFFDTVDQIIEDTGTDWFFVVNYACRIWPEAWIAFAHRAKKINVSFSLGTVRYVDVSDNDPWARAAADDPTIHSSRDDALAEISAMRSGRSR
ncbi:hypothetical protein EOI86_02830 [Hwanghaeella grinnelliae]|uniref:histidine kinase n=1 Tax=Hwanghaeella grinnelliae TaxID=2500179 RepID=A0A3S2VRU4_9PROT|nr:hypothetical protein [Hwanghaeella grinnelliae]RVU38247.1 hypothetical protein EOI86_02830 [Hwanghaeella grinnelliae]